MMRKSLVFLLLLAVLAGCGAEKETPPAAGAPPATATAEAEPTDVVALSAAERAAAGLRTGRLVSRPLGTGLAVNGTLDVPPENSVSITAPLGGYVQQTALLQGEHVRRGQVLAVLRNPEFVTLQQDYLETRARLRYAQAELARQRELYQQEVAPLKNYQLAQAQADALQVQTAAQAARLRIAGLPVGGSIQPTAPLRAPRAGFVRAVNVSVGQRVTPTEPLFELVDPDHLHVELTVFERDVAQVRKGQLIRFALASDSAGPGFGRTARVYLVGKAIGPDRTVRVHGHLAEAGENDPALLPGLYVRALIETGRTQVPTLPDAAVVRFGGQAYAFAVEAPGRYRLVPVRPGRREDGFTEVALPAATPASTVFVTAGAYSLLAKLKNTEEAE